MNDSGVTDDFFQAVMRADVVNVTCQCGAQTVMNAAYAKHVPGLRIQSCRECRFQDSQQK
jgi:hypothetical protein